MIPFRHRSDELSTEGDCVLWGHRVIVPARCRRQVLAELHEGHLGCAKMKQLARRHVWWPGLDAELEGQARDCAACREKSVSPPRATLHPWEPAGGPWERLHVDFGYYQGTNLLIVYDSFSKWIDCVPMRTITSERTVEVLRTLFSVHGLPRQMVSDNGRQFVSEEMTTFLRDNGVRPIRVAPFHASSNGAAERAVQTVKNGLRSSASEGGLCSADCRASYSVTGLLPTA